MTIRKTSHARYDLWYHFAWCTKYRKHVFKDPHIKGRIKVIFQTIAGFYDVELSEVNCLSDHIYFSAAAPPRIAPAVIVQTLKSLSTKMILKEYPWIKKQHYWGGEIWAGGYFVRSVGSGLTKDQIDKYIREQSEEI